MDPNTEQILLKMAQIPLARKVYEELVLGIPEKLNNITNFMKRCGYLDMPSDVLHLQMGHRAGCPTFKTSPGWIQIAVAPGAVTDDCVFPLYEYFPYVTKELQPYLCEFAALIPLGFMHEHLRKALPQYRHPDIFGLHTCKIWEKHPQPCDHFNNITYPRHDGYAFYTWHSGLRGSYLAHPGLLEATDDAFLALFNTSFFQDWDWEVDIPGGFCCSSYISEHKFHTLQAQFNILLYVYFIAKHGDHCALDCLHYPTNRCWAFLMERSMNWLAFAQEEFYFYDERGAECHPPPRIRKRYHHSGTALNRRIHRVYDRFVELVEQNI